MKKQYKKLWKKTYFCWHLESHCQKEKDPDLYQNVTDLEHWYLHIDTAVTGNAYTAKLHTNNTGT
jgi:hypothetical protein